MSWTVRFRFRVSTPLTSDATELQLVVGGRVAVITGGGKPLKESYWLTLNVHDFESKDVADQFGNALRPAVVLAGARVGVGIDAGEDRATASFGQAVFDLFEEQGHRLLPNVHGLLVYERRGDEHFVHVAATGNVTMNPTMLFDAMASTFDEASEIGEREQTALNLLSLSKMAHEPLAEAVLCISAVEFLSANGDWSKAQKTLLGELRELADARELPNDEATVVADAIARLFKNGVLASIRAKMFALGFTPEDWKTFRDVYKLRSDIFHGTTTDRRKCGELAVKARPICARIVLRAATGDGAT